MSVLVTVGVVVTSLLSAYAFAFLRFPLRRVVFALFLATLLVPGEVTVVDQPADGRATGAGRTRSPAW